MRDKAWILWAALALGVFAAHRVELPEGIRPKPTPNVVDVANLTPAMKAFSQALAGVSKDDLTNLSKYYSGLSASLATDPQGDPVVADTSELRRVHRAGLLFLWAGFLHNAPDKYPSLRSGIEGVLTESIGSEEVPLNPAIRQRAVDAFKTMAALCTNALR